MKIRKTVCSDSVENDTRPPDAVGAIYLTDTYDMVTKKGKPLTGDWVLRILTNSGRPHMVAPFLKRVVDIDGVDGVDSYPLSEIHASGWNPCLLDLVWDPSHDWEEIIPEGKTIEHPAVESLGPSTRSIEGDAKNVSRGTQTLKTSDPKNRPKYVDELYIGGPNAPPIEIEKEIDERYIWRPKSKEEQDAEKLDLIERGRSYAESIQNSETLKEILKVRENRPQVHGDTNKNFKAIADLWSTYLGVQIEPKQVGYMMALLKIARTMHGDKNNLDNAVDAANYIILSGDMSDEEDEEDEEDETN